MREGRFNQIWVGNAVWSQVRERRLCGISNRLGEEGSDSRHSHDLGHMYPARHGRAVPKSGIWKQINSESRERKNGRKKEVWVTVPLQVNLCCGRIERLGFTRQVSAFLAEARGTRKRAPRMKVRNAVFNFVSGFFTKMHLKFIPMFLGTFGAPSYSCHLTWSSSLFSKMVGNKGEERRRSRAVVRGRRVGSQRNRPWP